MKKILAVCFMSIFCFSCSKHEDKRDVEYFHTQVQQEDKGDIEYIHVQMQQKIRKGATARFKVFFKDMPEDPIIKLPPTKGLSFGDENKNIKKSIRPPSTYREYPYFYFSYVEAIETGKTVFPEIKVTIKGKQYKSPPLAIEVVDNLTVEPDDVFLILSSDKKRVKVGETLTLTIDSYSTHKWTKRIDDYHKVVKTKTGQVYVSIANKQVGIDNFKETLDEFFDWDRDIYSIQRNNDDRMKEVKGKRYFKQPLFKLTLTAKKPGVVNIGKSNLKFKIYENDYSYFGNYHFTEIDVSSNPLQLKVVN